MADGLNQVREAARQAIDAFIENRSGELFDYIDLENNMQNLQIAINRLNEIIIDITNPALFAGGVAQEILNEEGLNEVRDVAREAVHFFRDTSIPLVLNSINLENDMHNLENYINELNQIRAATNPALLAPNAAQN